MDASQQEHRNEHKCRRGEGKVPGFHHDIVKSIVFGHDSLLKIIK
jgi:hypothetical protein